MPTQTFTQNEIQRYYGVITDFVEPVNEQPVSKGLPVASITDDTEQSILLAQHIVSSPNQFNEKAWARLLLDWEENIKQRGLHDLLGPSTKRSLKALFNGSSASVAGMDGDTNGASMRIIPVGIAAPIEPLSSLIDQVEVTCRITHNTATAISAACAVAAVISAAIDGATMDEAIAIAISAAREGAGRGHHQSNTDIDERILAALKIGGSSANIETIYQELMQKIGTSVASTESVPCAFAVLKRARGDAWLAGLISANMGGDTDTIGAIAAGMTGACFGTTALPEKKLSIVLSVNQLKLDSLVDDLLHVRQQRNSESSSAWINK
jgi:ADP-ribosylglycohydrolase